MKIKVAAEQVTMVDVQIEDTKLVDSVIELINYHHDLHDKYLNADATEIREEDDYYHGSPTSHKVRDASKSDVEACTARRFLEFLKLDMQNLDVCKEDE